MSSMEDIFGAVVAPKTGKPGRPKKAGEPVDYSDQGALLRRNSLMYSTKSGEKLVHLKTNFKSCRCTPAQLKDLAAAISALADDAKALAEIETRTKEVFAKKK